MRKWSWLGLGLALLLPGCVSQEEKLLIHQKHAESAVFARRLDHPDPKLRPTEPQKDLFIKLTAQDWESLDKLHNHWKPAEPVEKPLAPNSIMHP